MQIYKKCVCPTLYCLNLYLVINTMFHVPCIYIVTNIDYTELPVDH